MLENNFLLKCTGRCEINQSLIFHKKKEISNINLFYEVY